MLKLADKTLYLLRHGRTVYNLDGILQGGTVDSPLSPLGISQVTQNGKTLKELFYQVEDKDIAFFSSPLGRARESTEYILKNMDRPLPVYFDPDLREVAMGEWDGKEIAQLKEEFPQLTQHPFQWFFNAPQGESYKEVVARCEDWIQRASVIPQKHVVVVAHGLLSRVLRGCLLGLSKDEALELPIPQEGFFVIQENTLDFVGGETEPREK